MSLAKIKQAAIKSLRGATGPAGLTGPQGPKGATGATGDSNVIMRTGVTVSVDAEQLRYRNRQLPAW